MQGLCMATSVLTNSVAELRGLLPYSLKAVSNGWAGKGAKCKVANKG